MIISWWPSGAGDRPDQPDHSAAGQNHGQWPWSADRSAQSWPWTRVPGPRTVARGYPRPDDMTEMSSAKANLEAPNDIFIRDCRRFPSVCLETVLLLY